MALAIGDIAPDFEAETTEGKIRFHLWIGNNPRATGGPDYSEALTPELVEEEGAVQSHTTSG